MPEDLPVQTARRRPGRRSGPRGRGAVALLGALGLVLSAAPVHAQPVPPPTTPSTTPPTAAPTSAPATPAPPTQPVPDCWGLPTLPVDPAGPPAREVDCLLVQVPRDHGDPTGPTISIAAAVVRAQAADPAEPVVVLGGGPGEKTLQALVPFVAADPSVVVDRTEVDRDVVVLDQRGVGLSRPALECPEVAAVDPFAGGSYVPAYAACFARLSATTDLSDFTTLQNVEDLDAVRRAVAGEGQVALYGTSYGARLALRAAGAHPGSWSAVVLSSPVPGEANFVAEILTDYEDALARLAAACAADAAGCGVAFPTLRADLDAAVQRLDAEPELVPLEVPGLPPTLPLDGSVLSNLVYSSLYLPPRPLPAVIDAFAEGRARDALLGRTSPGPRADQLPVDALAGLQPVPEPAPEPDASPTSIGMQASFLCAEEIGYLDRTRFAAQAAASSPTVRAFAAAPFFGLLDPVVCDAWDVPRAPAQTFDPVQSDVPTLVVTGGFDHITPPSYGPRALRGLPNGVLVNAPDLGHSPAFALGACGARLLADFLADPAGDLDASCAEDRPVVFDTVLAEAPTAQVARVGGPDRYATAARLSAWTFAPGAETVLLATGEDFPDGLAAGATGGVLDAPVLLTRRGALPQVTARELARLRPERVLGVGGERAVAEPVLAQARLAAGAPVERVAGGDRYATAAALTALLDGGARTAFVATGQDFPDALAASAAAGGSGAALLLTGRDVLPTATAAELARLGVGQVVVVGGAAAVSERVVAELRAVVPQVSRLAGPDRYATAAAVAPAAGPGTGWAFVATGEAFPDALTAAPVAAGRGPLLLVRRDGVPAVTGRAVAGSGAAQVGVVGGTAVISDATARQVDPTAVPATPAGAAAALLVRRPATRPGPG